MRSVRDRPFYSQDSSFLRHPDDCLGRILGSGFPQYAKASGRIFPARACFAGLIGNDACSRAAAALPRAGRPASPASGVRRTRISFGRRGGRPGPSQQGLPSGHRGSRMARVSARIMKSPAMPGHAFGRGGVAAGGRSRGDRPFVGRGLPVRGSLLRRQRRRSRCEGPAWRAVGRNVPPLFRPGA